MLRLMRTPPPDFSDLAERQHQIVSRGQLLAAGFDDMYLYRQTRRGLWQRTLPATASWLPQSTVGSR